MGRWYYQSVFDELDDMRDYMDALFRQMHDTSPTALLPASGEPAAKLLPGLRGSLRVDVVAQDGEVVVTADMIPGVTKNEITLDLINSRALEISCKRHREQAQDGRGYYLRERSFGSMTRIVPLPFPVTENGSTASFRNGVLEVHLRKSAKEIRGTIPIE